MSLPWSQDNQARVGRLPRWVGIKPLKKWRLRRLNIAEHVVINTFGGSIWSKLTTEGLLKHQQSEQSVCSLKLAHTCFDGGETASEEVASETSEHCVEQPSRESWESGKS